GSLARAQAGDDFRLKSRTRLRRRIESEANRCLLSGRKTLCRQFNVRTLCRLYGFGHAAYPLQARRLRNSTEHERHRAPNPAAARVDEPNGLLPLSRLRVVPGRTALDPQHVRDLIRV